MPTSATQPVARKARGCGHPRSDYRAGGCSNLTCFDLVRSQLSHFQVERADRKHGAWFCCFEWLGSTPFFDR